MRRVQVFYMLLCLVMAGCGQHITTVPKSGNDTIHTHKNDAETDTGLLVDTNTIALLPVNNIDFFSLKDSIPATLTNKDLLIIEKALASCVQDHNKGIDSTNLYGGYIFLEKFKRQYVPYSSSNGEKKIFINCFCRGAGAFNNWKKELVVVEDGGRCFFNITINLTKQSCGALLIHGPG